MKIVGYQIILRITRFVTLVIRPDYQKFCLRSTPDLILLLLLMMQPFNFCQVYSIIILRSSSFKLYRMFLLTKCFVIYVKSDFEMFCLIILNCQESQYSVLTSTPETWH